MIEITPDEPTLTAFTAAILGIVQGLTEFLPVSSSGHLEIAKYVVGEEKFGDPKDSMFLTVVLHFATALATIVVFRKEVWRILAGLLKFKKNDELDFSLKIILSMVPAVIVGLCFDEQIEALFDGQLLLVGLMLIVTAILLLLADRATKTEKSVRYLDSVIVGVAQAIAILPGISRSGATISTSVLLGIDREQAARFSFLMVVPLIFGKIAKDCISDDFSLGNTEISVLAVGFVAAFFTGIVACQWMIGLVKNARLSYFSGYCLIVAVYAIYQAVG